MPETWIFSFINVILSLVAVAVAEHGGIDTSVLCEISSGTCIWFAGTVK